MVVFTGGKCHSVDACDRSGAKPGRFGIPKMCQLFGVGETNACFFVPENTGSMAHCLNNRCSTNRSCGMLRLLDGMIIYDIWYERAMKVLQRLTLVAPTLEKVDAQALH